MNFQSIGFIGGGRITRIFLNTFRKKGLKFEEISVGDSNEEVLKKLKEEFPEVKICLNDNSTPASKDLVFVALHPPIISQVLPEIGKSLNPGAVVVSLAPKHTIQALSGMLGGFKRIARVIPNGPSYIQAGYNPVSFSQDLKKEDKSSICEILDVLGEFPEVPEEKLEAYTVLTAMGPTYFWFQWEEIRKIMASFGLTKDEFNAAFDEMIAGALKTYLHSGLTYEEVIDLTPGKPIKEDEETIKNIYQTRLNGIYQKLKG